MNNHDRKRVRFRYQKLKASGLLACGTIAAAMRIREERDVLATSRREESIPLTVAARSHAIDLCDSDADHADSLARDRFPRRQNWVRAAANCSSRGAQVADIDNGKYSSKCTYTHWTYQPVYRSCGVCSPKRLLWFRGMDRSVLLAPSGCRWGCDHLGIYVVRTGETRENYRLHVTGNMLLAGRRSLKSRLMRHEGYQRDAESRERQKARDTKRMAKMRAKVLRLGVLVGLRDSVASGNCPAGTKRWAETHDLTPTRYYPIDRIRAFAARNGNASQINRACEAAIDRSIADLARGYCEV